MIDSAILMRSVEHESSLHRMVSVMKHRQSWFDTSIREFSIGVGGISIGDRIDASKSLKGSAEAESNHL
jgi:circadian clock protein KaiC